MRLDESPWRSTYSKRRPSREENDSSNAIEANTAAATTLAVDAKPACAQQIEIAIHAAHADLELLRERAGGGVPTESEQALETIEPVNAIH